MSRFNNEQLRPTFPPKIPFVFYPMRCSQCKSFVDRHGPLKTIVGNVISLMQCKQGHKWLEILL